MAEAYDLIARVQAEADSGGKHALVEERTQIIRIPKPFVSGRERAQPPRRFPIYSVMALTTLAFTPSNAPPTIEGRLIPPDAQKSFDLPSSSQPEVNVPPVTSGADIVKDTARH